MTEQEAIKQLKQMLPRLELREELRESCQEMEARIAQLSYPESDGNEDADPELRKRFFDKYCGTRPVRPDISDCTLNIFKIYRLFRGYRKELKEYEKKWKEAENLYPEYLRKRAFRQKELELGQLEQKGFQLKQKINSINGELSRVSLLPENLMTSEDVRWIIQSLDAHQVDTLKEAAFMRLQIRNQKKSQAIHDVAKSTYKHSQSTRKNMKKLDKGLEYISKNQGGVHMGIEELTAEVDQISDKLRNMEKLLAASLEPPKEKEEGRKGKKKRLFGKKK